MGNYSSMLGMMGRPAGTAEVPTQTFNGSNILGTPIPAVGDQKANPDYGSRVGRGVTNTQVVLVAVGAASMLPQALHGDVHDAPVLLVADQAPGALLQLQHRLRQLVVHERVAALRAQRLARPVTVYIEQFSAHPLESDMAELYGPPDGYLAGVRERAAHFGAGAIRREYDVRFELADLFDNAAVSLLARVSQLFHMLKDVLDASLNPCRPGSHFRHPRHEPAYCDNATDYEFDIRCQCV